MPSELGEKLLNKMQFLDLGRIVLTILHSTFVQCVNNICLDILQNVKPPAKFTMHYLYPLLSLPA